MTVAAIIYHFLKLVKIYKISFNESLCGILAYISEKQVLAKGIWLKVAIKDG